MPIATARLIDSRLDFTRHLTQRAGFADTPVRIAAAADVALPDTVDALLVPASSIADAPPPGWTAPPS